jgi:WD40 repeat protein
VLVLPDWVRRVAVDYPLIATGSASGEVFLGSAETNQILTSTAHGRKVSSLSSLKEQEGPSGPGVVDELLLEQTCRVLYGSYDGGGTIAIAFRNKLVVDAPRSGGVRLHRVAKHKDSVALFSQGGIPALDGVLVTCLELQPDFLLVGTADGRVQAYPLEDGAPLFLQKKPRYEWKLADSSPSASTLSSQPAGPSGSFGSCSPITSLSPCAELQCVIATTAASSVQILSIPEDDDDDDDDDEDEDELVSYRHQELQPVASFYPPFDSAERKAANAFCLSAAVVKRVDANATASYAIVCGGNDGSLYVQPLSVRRPEEDGGGTRPASVVELALTSPLFPLRPFHNGPVVAMTSPAQGLVATASQDGTLRMYDVGSQTRYSRILYQFAGYKVWVGSLCVAHGDRLYTDGADNQVIGHHFRGTDADDDATKRADDGKAK